MSQATNTTSPVQVYSNPTAPVQNKGTNKLIFIIPVVMVACCLLCVGGIAAMVGVAYFETVGAQSVVKDLSAELGDDNYDEAARLFADEANANADDLEAQSEVFSGCSKVSFNSYEVISENGETVARLEGDIEYNDYREGTFESELVKEDDEWLLTFFRVSLD